MRRLAALMSIYLLLGACDSVSPERLSQLAQKLQSAVVTSSTEDASVHNWQCAVIDAAGRVVMARRNATWTMPRGSARAPLVCWILAPGHAAREIRMGDFDGPIVLQPLTRRLQVVIRSGTNSAAGHIPDCSLTRSLVKQDGEAVLTDQVVLRTKPNGPTGTRTGTVLVDEGPSDAIRWVLAASPLSNAHVWPLYRTVTQQDAQINLSVRPLRQVLLKFDSPEWGAGNTRVIVDDAGSSAWSEDRGDAYALQEAFWSKQISRRGSRGGVLLPELGAHVFHWDKTGAQYRFSSADGREVDMSPADPVNPPPSIRFADGASPPLAILVPGRICVDALGIVLGDEAMRTAVTVQRENGSWGVRRLAAAREYTLWHPDRGVAYVQPVPGGQPWRGQWQPGTVEWKIPTGASFFGNVVLRSRPPGSGKAFTWRSRGLLGRTFRGVQKVVVPGLPLGHYSVVVKGELRTPGGETIPVHRRAWAVLTNNSARVEWPILESKQDR